MTLAHEHVLGCQHCNSPLFITVPDESEPHRTARIRLVLTYEHTVAEILQGTKSAAPSFLHDMREDIKGAREALTPSMTSLHVLYMDGLEKAEARHDFAEHCNLDQKMLESNFVTIGHLTGAEVGACWCECHSGPDHFEGLEKAPVEDKDTPLTPVSVMGPLSQEHDRAVLGDSQVIPDAPRAAKKRKRWSSTDARRRPLRTRPHGGAGIDALDIHEWI